jgi:DNA-binding transcriptional ArsR family regulator
MSSTYTSAVGPGGDLDIASAAALFAEPSRARILMALDDGRALPASVLAAEARVSAQAASAQLAKLTAAGLIQVERSGRHRYYRLADPDVAAVLEALAHLSPVQPVRSLRQHTRAAALRNARTCYDHLAGRLGVQVTQALVAADALTTTDGVPDTRRRPGRPRSTSSRPSACHPSGWRRRATGPSSDRTGSSCGFAWTGPNSAITWRGGWAPTCSRRSSAPAGSFANPDTVPWR